MKSLFDIFIELEENDDMHMGRLLILLNAFAGRTGKGTIKGLTKLAKLDFLLRYPVYLERALSIKKAPTSKARVAEHERKSVESKMIRYKYGPWDFRYRRFINLLVSKELAHVSVTTVSTAEDAASSATRWSQGSTPRYRVIRAHAPRPVGVGRWVESRVSMNANCFRE